MLRQKIPNGAILHLMRHFVAKYWESCRCVGVVAPYITISAVTPLPTDRTRSGWILPINPTLSERIWRVNVPSTLYSHSYSDFRASTNQRDTDAKIYQIPN